MSLPNNLNLTTNKNTIKYSNLVLRKSEKGLTLHATLLDENSNPINLTGKSVTFSERKPGDKFVIDTNVHIDEPVGGKISYQLNQQCFAATGRAWFEILDAGGNIIDSTQDFVLEVKDATAASIANTNYVSAAQELVDKTNDLYQAAMSLKQQFETNTTNAINNANNQAQQQRNNINSQWSQQKAGFDQAFNAFKTEYQKVLDNNKNLDMSRFALATNLQATNARVTNLENAGYVKIKKCNSAEEARTWSQQNHGFAYSDD